MAGTREPQWQMRTETRWQWLNRVQSPSNDRELKQLQRWLDDWPIARHQDVEARLKSKDESGFPGARLELFAYQVLRRTLPNIAVEVPTESSPSASVPDFLLREANSIFDVECTIVQGPMPPRVKLDGMSVLDDAVKHIQVPGWRVLVQQVKPGPQTPDGRRIARYFDRLFRTLNASEYSADRLRSRFDEQPVDAYLHTVRDEPTGWVFVVRPVAVQEQDLPDRLWLTYNENDEVHVRVPGEGLDLAAKRKVKQHRERGNDMIIVASYAGVASFNWHIELEASMFGLHRGFDFKQQRNGARFSSECVWPISSKPHQPIAVLWLNAGPACPLPNDDLCLVENPHREPARVLRNWPLNRLRLDLRNARVDCIDGTMRASELLHDV